MAGFAILGAESHLDVVFLCVPETAIEAAVDSAALASVSDFTLIKMVWPE